VATVDGEGGAAPLDGVWDLEPLLASSEPQRAPLRCAVLLSGGVDSSVSLALAKAAGHDVEAFYLQIWFQEDFRNFWGQCPWEEDLEYCKAVCSKLGVQLHVVPMTDDYWSRVVSASIDEIRRGRTPNPDLLCNSRVKFGAFLDHLDGIDVTGGFDRVVSGHYARIVRGVDEASGAAPVRLSLTPDATKDQTYFLAGLTQAQLRRCMFPIGHLTKAEVRAAAHALDLPTKDRKDSQGICFLGKVPFDEFVEEHLGEWPGPLVDEATGDVVGYHRGFWFFTVGQRKGIGLPGGPWFVCRKDVRHNVVYISNRYADRQQGRDCFVCGPVSWLSGEPVDLSALADLRVKVRHGPNLYRCAARHQPSGLVEVQLERADQGLAAGQYAVFYAGGECLGSAVMHGASAAEPR